MVAWKIHPEVAEVIGQGTYVCAWGPEAAYDIRADTQPQKGITKWHKWHKCIIRRLPDLLFSLHMISISPLYATLHLFAVCLVKEEQMISQLSSRMKSQLSD